MRVLCKLFATISSSIACFEKGVRASYSAEVWVARFDRLLLERRECEPIWLSWL